MKTQQRSVHCALANLSQCNAHSARHIPDHTIPSAGYSRLRAKLVWPAGLAKRGHMTA